MANIKTLIERCNNDSVLLGAIQEYAQLRENPISRMMPCAKYVQINSIEDQLKKLKAEIKEFEEAKTFDEKVKEWFDITQVGVTGLGILETKYGQDIGEVVMEGQKKNEIRGYNSRI